MKKILIALSAMLLLSGCATPFGTRLMAFHKAKPHAVTHETIPVPSPTPIAAPVKPPHKIKWFH